LKCSIAWSVVMKSIKPCFTKNAKDGFQLFLHYRPMASDLISLGQRIRHAMDKSNTDIRTVASTCGVSVQAVCGLTAI
jgi:hypothetical protein